MRRFSSYGPVDPAEHFAVERRGLVEQCVDQLVGNPQKSGHYFTIWGPRQTGKTWIMQRAVEEIRAKHGDRFEVGALSMQGVAIEEGQPPEAFFPYIPQRFELGFGRKAPEPRRWADWTALFARGGYFDRPAIVCIDEFDSLPRSLIDRLVSLFRDMYLNRAGHRLHGLALVGVRAVLGVESLRGSPFNVQRTMRVPNLTREEVTDLCAQYEAESKQPVSPEVVTSVFESTRGQPGLVSWFGELLTEKHNPGPEQPISLADWRRVYVRACQVEWNNTMLNLVKKAREPYATEVMRLFTDPNVPFLIEQDWCAYLYMNGIIDEAPPPGESGEGRYVCRFANPFVQLRLYSAFTDDLFGAKAPVLALVPGDTLSDVFTPDRLVLPPLLKRYRGYLERLKARGVDPFRGQPRRSDLHITEAVGHFHLYAWLRDAIGHRSIISPEFPTGNGKVDLVIRHKTQLGVLEVKSFVDMYLFEEGKKQTAGYAKKLGLSEATMAVFVPVSEDEIPKELSEDAQIDGVRISVVPFGSG